MCSEEGEQFGGCWQTPDGPEAREGEMGEFAEGVGTAGERWRCFSSRVAREVEEMEETCLHGEDPFSSQMVRNCTSF